MKQSWSHVGEARKARQYGNLGTFSDGDTRNIRWEDQLRLHHFLDEELIGIGGFVNLGSTCSSQTLSKVVMSNRYCLVPASATEL